MQYEKGQYVRSRGGYPARALGILNFCLRKTANGTMILDTARQPDVTVQEHQVPSVVELNRFLDDHQAAQAHAGEAQAKSVGRE